MLYIYYIATWMDFEDIILRKNKSKVEGQIQDDIIYLYNIEKQTKDMDNTKKI